ncbi:methionyl-tRNA synthetase [Candidatus Kryptonium thompsonii]|uniref:Methionine--tRNA ligase n=1 Tax=Candidatus Kryptonium thompsonii TaxID=1633631 RepID=A0A0P1P3F9_9BACT|nr:methionine--tRNA ligase [Candidatus Kryptonium thompsoni]CUS81141.1 methionyl-tRNA synthetase [Candidatus Kryptonium thompsoni]CUS81244.1 methionyl-tRNA synthetase [Candidatus Kryptonium thompsoni]CUS81398.1 methionyl-tRNA synthetase [Candidatus Kryptonium thompsoni]CUS82197.1 methionyl-tRNA synthetase [Candidatus Kryptonium thompsoni]CUS88666.1 methionyl-tRNA synthetase [Candidatus Kryptonium thompsoni]
MGKNFKRILVTAALPYANGPIHLGHLAGAYLPADIYVRYQRLKGRDVLYICGSDEHGVPITITAEKEGITPQQVVDKYHYMNKESFERFGMSFDNYSRTSLPLHHQTAQEFFLELYKKGILKEKTTKQLYCEKDRMFLADRYVEGICPVCGSPGARGDQCEKCGSWLEQTDLIEPKCKICGSTPVIRDTSHWYLPLGEFQKKLEEWMGTKTDWKENVKHYVYSWFKEGLQDRAVTRDLHWGVKVPIPEAEGKVIYVWFDALLGYISSTKEWAQKIGQPEKWREYWQDPDTRLIHFIGKDNIVFHCIVFPAMLMAWNEGRSDEIYVLPDNVPANEFLNLEGKKLSTSRNYAVWLNEYLEKFEPDPLRYALASILPETKDTDFSWKEFQARNNNELADILGNFVNRTLTFAKKNFDNRVPERFELEEIDKELIAKLKEHVDKIANNYENFRIRDGVFETMNLARFANKYFNDTEPWRMIKENPRRASTTINLCLQLVRALAILFEPVLPFSSRKIWEMLNLKDDIVKAGWDSAAELLLEAGHQLGEPKILFRKIEDAEIEDEIRKLKIASGEIVEEKIEFKPQIDIKDFEKIDLRVAEVIECERVKNSEKLLKLKVKIGREERQIVAGIGKHYKPEELIGKRVVVVANLKPAKLMGIESQGMLLAAVKDEKLTIITTLDEIDSGSQVR